MVIKQEVHLEIETVAMESVYEIKFLGVLIDHKLGWRPHIKYVCYKVSRSIGILGKTKQKSHLILYYALIDPYLSYSADVWGNAYKCTLQKIWTLQKRVIRMVHHAGYIDHTNPFFCFFKSGVLKFKDIVKFKTVQIWFKACNKLLPSNIQKMFIGQWGKIQFTRES